MTIEITQDVVAVSEEFSMSKYSSKLERDAALLQEIVNLREKNEHLRKKYEQLEKDFDNYIDLF